MTLLNKFTEYRSRRKQLKEEAIRRESFRREIISSLDFVAERLQQIRDNYDIITENELIEAAIYEERALLARYAYLLRTARENDIKCKLTITE